MNGMVELIRMSAAIVVDMATAFAAMTAAKRLSSATATKESPNAAHS